LIQHAVIFTNKHMNMQHRKVKFT